MAKRKNTAKRLRPVVTTKHRKEADNERQQKEDAQKRPNKRDGSLCSKDVCGAPGEKKSIFYLMYTHNESSRNFRGFPAGSARDSRWISPRDSRRERKLINWLSAFHLP